MNGDVAVAARLCTAWTEILDPVFGKQTRCIESTKIALAALRRLDVQARPLPCGIVVANGLAARLIEEDVPVSEWPPRAWSTGVDPDARQGGRCWDGHLIVQGDGWVADYAGAQFSRPAPRRVVCGAWVSAVPDGWTGKETFKITNGETVVSVFPRPELAAWRNSNAWRSRVPLNEVDALVRHVEKQKEHADV